MKRRFWPTNNSRTNSLDSSFPELCYPPKLTEQFRVPSITAANIFSWICLWGRYRSQSRSYPRILFRFSFMPKLIRSARNALPVNPLPSPTIPSPTGVVVDLLNCARKFFELPFAASFWQCNVCYVKNFDFSVDMNFLRFLRMLYK